MKLKSVRWKSVLFFNFYKRILLVWSYLKFHHCDWQLAPSSSISGPHRSFSTISCKIDNPKGPTGTDIDKNNICWWVGREKCQFDKLLKMIYFFIGKYINSTMFNKIVKIHPARILSCIDQSICLDCLLFMKEYLHTIV